MRRPKVIIIGIIAILGAIPMVYRIAVVREGKAIVAALDKLQAEHQRFPEELPSRNRHFQWRYNLDNESGDYTLRCYVFARASVVYFSDDHPSAFKGWYWDGETGEMKKIRW